MKHLRLAIGYALCLAVFTTAGCKPKARDQVVGEPFSDQSASSPSVTSPAQQPSSSPSPIQPSEIKAEQVQSLDLPKLANRVRSAVILVSVFDSAGKLLRTETGFFISDDGKLITTAHTIEGGVNGVAKTGDGGIYNVTGILASSSPLDLAILKADVKQVPFLVLNKNGNLPIDVHVGVVGSGLAGSEGTPREAAITTQQSDRLEVATAISPSSIGSPLVDANGEVVGVVISAHEKCIARPASAITWLQSQIASDAKARWLEPAETRPTPRPTPRPRLIYAPPPSFPPEAYSRPGSRSGRFRLSFNAKGNVTNIQIIQSTGNDLLGRAATDTLRRWKSAPGQEWVATVPITFQGR
jgi:TonB family protein